MTAGRVVPARAIQLRLAAAGFQRVEDPGSEEVYERVHARDRRYSVQIRSSIHRGAPDVVLERDVIRVFAICAETVRAGIVRGPLPEVIFGAPGIPRAGAAETLLDRMIECAREAYATCNRHRATRKDDRL